MAVPGFVLDHWGPELSSGLPRRPRGSGGGARVVRGPDVRSASCFGECFSECISEGGMSKAGCNRICTVECGGKPRDNPPYQCKPTDNSVNHTLCMGAQDAWGYAASAECGLLLGVPVVGALLGAACVGAVTRVVAEGKAGCPPAVICV